MKSLKDIFSSSKNTSVDVRNPDKNVDVIVGNITPINTSDVSPGKWTIPDIRWDMDIRLSQKLWINFDALEKSNKRKKKDILIKQKNKYIDIHAAFILWVRKAKNMSLTWWIYLSWALFLCVVVLWYIDKVIVENRVNAWYEKLLSLKSWGKSVGDIKKVVNNSRFDFLIADSRAELIKILYGFLASNTLRSFLIWDNNS